MNEQNNVNVNVNSTLDEQSSLNDGVSLQSRDAVIWALCELLDGENKWRSIQESTGATQAKCKRILAIRDAVQDEWINSIMKIPIV